MAVLEEIVRGAGVGATKVLDPVGTIVNGVEKYLLGIGPADARALPTISSAFEKQLNTGESSVLKGHLPRLLGAAMGIGGAVAGLAGLYYAVEPAAAYLIPIATGIYSGLMTIGKYISNFIRGEPVNGQRHKAGFKDGLKYGWQHSTHLNILPEVESFFTGKGYEHSKFTYGTKDAAPSMRRNGLAVLGSTLGHVLGYATSAVTAGIFPALKSVRATYRTMKGAPPAAAPAPPH